MTTIITRLYKDDSAVNAVVSSLSEAGFPEKTYSTIGGGGDAAAAMADAQVGEEAAAAYAPLIGQGNKLVVVRAPFAPFGAAKAAMKIVDSQPTVDAGLENENVFVSEEMAETSFPSILRDTHFADFLVPLISRRDSSLSQGMGVRSVASRKPRTSAVGRSGHWSTPILDIPLIRRGERELSVFQGTKRFGAFLMPLISKREPSENSVFKGTVRFGDFLAPLIIRR
jgi:hypothetical protein